MHRMHHFDLDVFLKDLSQHYKVPLETTQAKIPSIHLGHVSPVQVVKWKTSGGVFFKDAHHQIYASIPQYDRQFTDPGQALGRCIGYYVNGVIYSNKNEKSCT